MGDARLSTHLREELQDIAERERPKCTNPDGSIDRKRLAAAISTALRGDLRLRATLAQEGSELAIKAFVADMFRDRKKKVTVGGRTTKLRDVYAVPMPGGKWVTKSIDDLSPEDLEKIERHIQSAALGQLRAAKDIRTLKGFAQNPMPQMTLDDAEFAEAMEPDADDDPTGERTQNLIDDLFGEGEGDA